jgi:gamma-glutamylcyclotransferase (GGCT)/AIG2-like uncharacterized protein YtfP
MAMMKDESTDLGPGMVFVCGTLMRGEPRHDLIRKHGPTLLVLAEAPGRLVEAQGEPLLVDSNDGPRQLALGAAAIPCDGDPQRTSRRTPGVPQIVQGEVVSCGDFDGLVEALDHLFSFHGPGREENLHERREVWVGMRDGKSRSAWAYFCVKPPAGAVLIPSGDWRAHRETRQAFLRALVKGHCGRAEKGTAKKLARWVCWWPKDLDAEAAKLLPLADALGRRDFSERQLAQITGKWAVEV